MVVGLAFGCSSACFAPYALGTAFALFPFNVFSNDADLLIQGMVSVT